MAALRPDSVELEAGSLFAGRYRIEGLLGRGGMGAVYRARDLYLAEPVGLKILPVRAASSPALALRFRQEVKLARRVSHPSVIRVHDIGEEDQVLFLTMEIIEGPTLRELLDGTPLPVARALHIARSIAEGLAAAHAEEIIHRDLKPSNVLVDGKGRVVLSDFGIARLIDDELALTQGPIGTPTYMAPEQASSGPVDGRTDLYALGLVLYEMLAGERPAGTAAQIAARLEGRTPPLPPSLAALTLQCLARDPDGRPASARAFLDALAGLSSGAGDDGITLAQPLAKPAAEPTRPALTATISEPYKLAVLPFRHRGPEAQSYIADVLTDELVDALCRTRGLRVLGSGATARFRDNRDPIQAGRELGVRAVIDGAVQTGGERIRATVRLLEATTGVQRWTQLKEGSAGDLFAFQESVVRRVAEDLRIELTTLAHEEAIPAAAIERYLEARRDLRLGDFQGCRQAAELLDRALELAPAFAPALAARALASVRAYFYQLEAEGHDWEQEAAASVERAEIGAGMLAESHLASSMFHTQRGGYFAAAAALVRALDIAPTCAPAHAYLGMLQAEAGRLDSGLEHLDIAAELDPTSVLCLGAIARVHALRGDARAFAEVLAKLERAERSERRMASWSVRMRAATWRGDLSAAREVLERAGAIGQSPHGRILLAYARAALGGDVELSDVERVFTTACEQARSPRLLSLTLQLAAEAYAAAGRHDLALGCVARAAGSVLIDIVWLERCPLLLPLAERPEMKEHRRRVRERADAFWGA